ncbi:MAG: hypothetical protein K1X53_02335 [Candidatus Sumerlaeaceae bacterium]|nr:hypothetical protein [Candidatus Sumerlaeaceae bacterium]
MRNVVALVLAGGYTANFGVLTQNRPKAALTFAASYRIVDFALSNLRNSQIEQVGIIIQYLPSSLIEHVGVGQPWDLQGYGRLLKIMPPFVGVDNTDWYNGTADALYQNLNLLDDLSPEHVVVASGEQVYKLDFAEVMASHRDRNADITMVTKSIPESRCTHRFGYATVGDGGRLTAFVEKPESFPSTEVSTGITVFKASVLRDLLEENARGSSHNLAKDILSKRVGEFKSYVYSSPDYWEYLEDLADYYRVQFELLECGGQDQIRQWGILTNMEYRGLGFAAPAHFTSTASVQSTVAAGNCRIAGTTDHCILSPGVVVEKGAVVRNSILLHDCRVEDGAVVENVVADKDVVFGSGCRVGVDVAEGTPANPHFGNLTLIGKSVQIMEGARVPRGTELAPGRGPFRPLAN